ncbi:MAG: HAD hydrolase-like protein [Burkholderiales bacterium]|nr:HAD hydrolase-like protein [Burkholderiales bacterium]
MTEMTYPQLSNIKGVLFDLDGTLMNTLPGLTQLVNQVRDDFNKQPLPESTVCLYIGKGIPMLLHRALTDSMDKLLPPNIYQMALDSLNEHVREGNYSHGVPYPNVVDAVKRLRKHGYKVGMVTNKLYDMTIDELQGSGLIEIMDVIIGGDSAANPKPFADPVLAGCKAIGTTPEETVMIGDSGNDSGAAAAAGTKCLLVRTGWNEGKSLDEIAKRDNVIAILDTVKDAVDLIIRSKAS